MNVLAFKRAAATPKVLQVLPSPSPQNSPTALFSGAVANSAEPGATLALANSKAEPEKSNNSGLRLLRSSGSAQPHRDHESDSAALDQLIQGFVENLSWCPGHLIRVRVSGRPGTSARALAEFIGAFSAGSFATIESSPDGQWEHLHGLLLVESLAEAQDLLDATVRRFGLSANAQHIGPFRGLRAFQKMGDEAALRSNLHAVFMYDLALLKHAGKRSREIPVAVVATGALAALAPLAAFALEPGAVKVAPVRLCGALLPSGKPCPKCLSGRQQSCSATCRSRKSRATTVATLSDIPESVAVGSSLEVGTAVAPVPIPGVSPAQVVAVSTSRLAPQSTFPSPPRAASGASLGASAWCGLLVGLAVPRRAWEPFEGRE